MSLFRFAEPAFQTGWILKFVNAYQKNTRFQSVRCTVAQRHWLTCFLLKFCMNCLCEFGAGSNVDVAFTSIQLIHQRVDPVAFNGLFFLLTHCCNQIKYFGKQGCQLFAMLKWPAQNRRLQAIWRYVPWECVQFLCAITSVRFWRPCHFGVRPQPIVDPVALKACILFCHVVAPNRLVTSTGCQLFKQRWSDQLKTENSKLFEGMFLGNIFNIFLCAHFTSV